MVSTGFFLSSQRNKFFNNPWECIFIYKYLFISGTRIIYDRNFLLQMRNSPVARTPPKNLPLIPGVTCDKEKPQRSAHSHQKQVTKPAESSAVIAEVEKGICSLPTNLTLPTFFKIFVCVISSGREETRGASIWNGYLSGMSTKKNAKLTPHRSLSMMPFVDVEFFFFFAQRNKMEVIQIFFPAPANFLLPLFFQLLIKLLKNCPYPFWWWFTYMPI